MTKLEIFHTVHVDEKNVCVVLCLTAFTALAMLCAIYAMDLSLFVCLSVCVCVSDCFKSVFY